MEGVERRRWDGTMNADTHSCPKRPAYREMKYRYFGSAFADLSTPRMSDGRGPRENLLTPRHTRPTSTTDAQDKQDREPEEARTSSGSDVR